MKHLIYRSRLVDTRGALAVPDILRVARSRNATEGITGVMLFDGERFCQHLEGEDHAVDLIFGSIGRDARHANVQVLSETPVRSRRYPTWSMAFGRSATRTLIESLGDLAPDDVADELQDALPRCDLEA